MERTVMPGNCALMGATRPASVFSATSGCLPYLRRKLCKRTPRVPRTDGIFAICTSAPSHLCMPAGPNGHLPYLRRKLCKRTPRVPRTEIT